MPDVSKLCDLAAEQALLGSVLHSNHAYAETAWMVHTEDFQRGAHATVWEAVSDMRAEGRAVDTVTVHDELARRGWLDHIGGATALADLSEAAPSAVNAKRYARIVSDLARRRRLAETGQQVAAKAADPAEDVDQAIAEASDRLAGTATHTPTVPSSSLVSQAMTTATRGSEQFGYPAPWPALRTKWRIVPGWVHVAIGFRSAGKSAFVDALVVGLAYAHGVRTLMWSPESAPSGDHLLRLAKIQAGAAVETWPEAKLREQLAKVTERVAWMDHESYTTMPSILAAADSHRMLHGLDVLVIDPFTSVAKFDGGADEGWDRLLNRHLSRLQQWARSRQVAVVMVAHPKQRDRVTVDAPGGKKASVRPVPTDADIAGGAMWSNQADSLIAVWRDEQGQLRPAEHIDVYVQKVRDDGPGGKMGARETLRRDEFGRYQAIEYRYEGQPA